MIFFVSIVDKSCSLRKIENSLKFFIKNFYQKEGPFIHQIYVPVGFYFPLHFSPHRWWYTGRILKYFGGILRANYQTTCQIPNLAPIKEFIEGETWTFSLLFTSFFLFPLATDSFPKHMYGSPITIFIYCVCKFGNFQVLTNCPYSYPHKVLSFCNRL